MTTSEQTPAAFTKDQKVTLAHCRTYQQYCAMADDYLAGRCPFCQLDPKKNRVIKEFGAWCAWENPFPHEHTERHLIFAPRHHIGPEDEITEVDFGDMYHLFAWARREVAPRGGVVTMRYGDPELTAASVLHLHGNLQVPDGTGAVAITIAKDLKKKQEGIDRAVVFEKIRCQGIEVDLTERELELVRGRMP